jgi:kynurenine formamidase
LTGSRDGIAVTDTDVPDSEAASAAFRSLHAGLAAGVPWGPDDRRGALNYLTRQTLLAARAQIQLGTTFSLAADIEHSPGPDNREPAQHRMLSPVGDDVETSGLAFARDRLAMNIHGDADSHLDALSHVSYDGLLYNGVPAQTLTARGAQALSVDAARDGIAGRGVLLDIPRLRGVRWLEPGDHVTAADLTSAEEVQDVRVGSGDLLLIRVGHRRRRRELGAWDAAHSRAGLHPAAAAFLAERQVAVLGSDGNNDTAPSAWPDVDFPVHALAINALGVCLLDYLELDDLAAACHRASRWAFFCVIAPLRMRRATGSPVNPIAIL